MTWFGGLMTIGQLYWLIISRFNTKSFWYQSHTCTSWFSRDVNRFMCWLKRRRNIDPKYFSCSLANYTQCDQYCAVSLLEFRIVKSSRLPAKIATCLVSIGQLLCLAFLYGWHFFKKKSLDWPLTLTTQLSTSKLSDNPVS